MSPLIFSIVSISYLLALAIIDATFNRLVFREHASLPYGSTTKQAIYRLPEWKIIGVLLLLYLPVILPSILSFLLGGIKYLLLYLTILCLTPWVSIFGKIVFGDWTGDTPSIALPFIGWIQTPLSKNIYSRCLLASLLTYLLIRD